LKVRREKLPSTFKLEILDVIWVVPQVQDVTPPKSDKGPLRIHTKKWALGKMPAPTLEHENIPALYLISFKKMESKSFTYFVVPSENALPVHFLGKIRPEGRNVFMIPS
jgi:hypothetical protein